MGDLSKNFDRREFACKCGCGFDTPDPRLVAALQELRNRVGLPIRINSACRCPAHNAAVGGAPQSYHLKGQAADIVIDRLRPTEVAKLAERIRAFNLGGIITYPAKGFVHVDVRGRRYRETKH